MTMECSPPDYRAFDAVHAGGARKAAAIARPALLNIVAG
jgi:hypothetical protein